MSRLSAEYAFRPIHELAAEMRTAKLSPEHLVELYLQRIEKYDTRLSAFVAVYAQEAQQLARASALMISAGNWLGPLHGIPVAVKDLIEIEGRVTTGGAAIWRDRVSTHTADVVHKLKAAGAIIIGKTHTVEFAYGGHGTNQHMGTPWNPWDLHTHRIPGGSSSGSAVATAAGLAGAALGSDTGGSVRIPSAYCGLVGLKTTVGRISTYGVLPLSRTLDTLGPLSRSVEDAALLFNALALQGSHHAHPHGRSCSSADVMPTLRRGVEGMRFALLPEAERTFVDGHVLDAYDESIEVLKSLGGEVVSVALPAAMHDFAAAVGCIISAEAYHELHRYVDDDTLVLDENVRARIRAGRDISAKDYLQALRQRQQFKCELAQNMDGVDALLTPATTTAAIPLAEVEETVSPAFFTRFGNLLDLCGVAVPNGFTPEGLPTSLLITGQGYDEARVLRIAWAFEQATLAHKRVPGGLGN